MTVITIRFDGGCQPTNPGNKYGSFQVEMNGFVVHRTHRIQLGYGTNNEAEFEMLLMALEWTRNQLQREGLDCSRYHLEMMTDSMIVRNRVSGRNRTNKTEPQQRMNRLANACLEYLKDFGGYEIIWNRREANVVLFGH